MKHNRYKINTKILSFIIVLTIGLSACIDDLDKLPTNGITSKDQFNSVEGYKQGLVSVYSNLAYGDFLRYYWMMQEYTTDEAVSTWNDNGDGIYHQLAWSADAAVITSVYTAALKTITYCNNYINESDDAKIAERGFTGTDATTIKQFKAETRFLRAYCYWVLMDVYGNPPFPTEKTLGFSAPEQIQRKDLFTFIESELKVIEPELAAPKTNEWGRADKAAAWSLLARMYLNGKVYTGTEYYTEAITYCNNVLTSGYSLETHYRWLMLGDNQLNTNEFIFTINYDDTNVTWSGTNFIALGASGVTAEISGMVSSWSNFRFTQQIPALFPTADSTVDKRAQFYTTGQTLHVTTISSKTDGYSSYKYRNVNRDGSAIAQKSGKYNNLSDIDFPVFRLAEIYLTYAEAVLRGGAGGSTTTALGYVNKLRGRAYANDPSSIKGNILPAALTLDFILNEKAREMYWEAQRRTDLVRYDRLTTSDYLWAWKGGTLVGRGVESKYNLFPIPTSDLLANPNLKQIDNF
jgi:hypothetical protein